MVWMRILVCLAVCGVLVSASELLDKKHCKCRVLPEKKIVGGKEAHHLAYPWMASINLREDRLPGEFAIPGSDRLLIDFLLAELLPVYRFDPIFRINYNGY